jgi:hypothetical protein
VASAEALVAVEIAVQAAQALVDLVQMASAAPLEIVPVEMASLAAMAHLHPVGMGTVPSVRLEIALREIVVHVQIADLALTVARAQIAQLVKAENAHGLSAAEALVQGDVTAATEEEIAENSAHPCLPGSKSPLSPQSNLWTHLHST